MQFSVKTKLADIIHNNYLLLPIFNRFGIQLGFGDKTVDDNFGKYLNKEWFSKEVIQ